MSDEDKLQKLLRLKNYESPGDEYFENLLVDVRQRQRQDAMKLSPGMLLKERVSEWYEDMGSARWAVPAGSFAAVLLTFFAVSGKVREEPLSHTEPPKGVAEDGPVPKVVDIELQLPGNNSSASGNGSVLPIGYSDLREF